MRLIATDSVHPRLHATAVKGPSRLRKSWECLLFGCLCLLPIMFHFACCISTFDVHLPEQPKRTIQCKEQLGTYSKPRSLSVARSRIDCFLRRSGLRCHLV